MGQNSTIEWTHHTFNPWWGCTKVSPGCTHCYAETWANRYGHDIWGPRKARRIFGESHWQDPVKWNRQAMQQGERIRVFCASMADVFEDNASIREERKKLWSLIEETPMLDWLLLTKRPENMLRFAPWQLQWPSNIWAMTSIENQEQAEKRIPLLAEVLASVRGLSVEPLIGPVNLAQWLQDIHWVIVGGESGPGSRPINPEWVRSIRDQCTEANVPFFFKQWGEWAPIDDNSLTSSNHQVIQLHHNGITSAVRKMGKKASGRLLDGKAWSEFPLVQSDFLPSLAYG